MAKQKADQGTQVAEEPNITIPPPVGDKKRKVCPVTREQFNDAAKPVKLTLEYDGKTYVFAGSPREFNTGSLGWNINDKTVLDIDGKPCQAQLGVNLTLTGSKELPGGGNGKV